MYRLIPAGCVLALSLMMPRLAAQGTAADNPAAQKLNRDIARHKEFLKRIEQSKGVGDVIFLGDSITHGWEGQKAWQEHFGSFKPNRKKRVGSLFHYWLSLKSPDTFFCLQRRLGPDSRDLAVSHLACERFAFIQPAAKFRTARPANRAKLHCPV